MTHIPYFGSFVELHRTRHKLVFRPILTLFHLSVPPKFEMVAAISKLRKRCGNTVHYVALIPIVHVKSLSLLFLGNLKKIGQTATSTTI